MRTGSDEHCKTRGFEFVQSFDTEPRDDGVHVVGMNFSEKHDFFAVSKGQQEYLQNLWYRTY